MTTTRSHGPRYDLVPPPPTKVDGPTMWARWNAFDDSAYQELMAREREARQRVRKAKQRERQAITWSFVAFVLFEIICFWQPWR